jgi:hypothetical protein
MDDSDVFLNFANLLVFPGYIVSTRLMVMQSWHFNRCSRLMPKFLKGFFIRLDLLPLRAKSSADFRLDWVALLPLK